MELCPPTHQHYVLKHEDVSLSVCTPHLDLIFLLLSNELLGFCLYKTKLSYCWSAVMPTIKQKLRRVKDKVILIRIFSEAQYKIRPKKRWFFFFWSGVTDESPSISSWKDLREWLWLAQLNHVPKSGPVPEGGPGSLAQLSYGEWIYFHKEKDYRWSLKETL